MLKILHVIDSGGLYGAEVMLLNLVDEQIRQGLRPTICSIGTLDLPEKPLETEALRRGFRVKKFRMRAGLNISGALKILRFAQAEHFDLMHSHGFKGNIFFGFMPRRYRKIPLVATLHGWTSFNNFTRMKLYEWLDGKTLKYMDAVVLVSNGMLTNPKLKKHHSENFRVINNGIPPQSDSMDNGDKLDSKIMAFCEKGFIVGTIGRLSDYKGFHHLIEAFSRLTQQFEDMKLLIIGEGAERNRLEQMVKELGLQEKVLMPGYRVAASEYLPSFNVFVLPSLTEGLPITILEAMRNSVPIIATRVGGVPEILDNGDAGILVKPGDSKVLMDSISYLYKRPSHRKKMAEKSHEIVVNRFSSKKMAQRYFEIYNSLQPDPRTH